MKIDVGKYIVEVTIEADDLYKVEGKNIYIHTQSCNEYSFSEEVILKVERSYGYSKGKLIF